MTWWEEFQKAVADGLESADRSTRAEVGAWFGSGATTPTEAQAAIDAKIGGVKNEDERAKLVEDAADVRAKLIETLVGTGYTGDVDSMSSVELAKLLGELQVTGLRGSATPPDASAMDAAAAAQAVGGNISIDERSGAVELIGQDGTLHEYIAPGAEGRPAEIVAGEIMIGSERGGPRPLPEDIRAAIDALLKAGWDPNAPGDGGISYGKDGDVIATFPDGTTRVWQHDDLRQTLADLEASAGSMRDIGSALDRGATSFGLDALGNFNRFLGSLGIPGFDWGMGGGGTGGGSMGTGSGGGGATGGTNGGGGGTGGSTTPTGPQGGTSGESADDFDTWTGEDGGGSGDADDDDDDDESGDTGPAQPGTTEPNEIVERHPENDNPEGGEEDDGWAPSTIDPPTDSTYVDSDGDGVPDDEEDSPDSSGDANDGSDDDEDEDEEDSGDDADPDAEYTPAPDGEGRKVPTEEELERLAAAAAARGGWADRPPIKAPEYDEAFVARMQERKLGMIGNPGDPDLDLGGAGGNVDPGSIVPTPNPDDDTPGHDSGGVDKGEEDPMQQGGPQGPLDPSLLTDEEAAPLAPQETVAAELNYGDEAPLEVAVEAEVHIVGTPSLPGYHHALGDPVGDGAGDGAGDGDGTSDAAESVVAGRATRPGGELSIPATIDLAAIAPDDSEDG